MSEAYQAHPLTSHTADMTYPLVQMMQVDMSFDRWRAFVDRYCLPVGDTGRTLAWPGQPMPTSFYGNASAASSFCPTSAAISTVCFPIMCVMT